MPSVPLETFSCSEAESGRMNEHFKEMKSINTMKTSDEEGDNKIGRLRQGEEESGT